MRRRNAAIMERGKESFYVAMLLATSIPTARADRVNRTEI